MTRTLAFNHLLEDKENGLSASLRKVWKHRFTENKLSENLVIAQLRNYGYKESDPDIWFKSLA